MPKEVDYFNTFELIYKTGIIILILGYLFFFDGNIGISYFYLILFTFIYFTDSAFFFYRITDSAGEK